MRRTLEQLDPNFAGQTLDDGLVWFDARAFGIEGQGWTDVEMPYDRLPARAKELVGPKVWDLSRHSAGLCVRFVTNSPALAVRWKLTSEQLAMSHMPATGVSGADLYLREPRGWRYAASGKKFDAGQGWIERVTLSPAEKEFTLYLPLYNGVSSVQIGIDPSAAIRPAPPRRGGARPIVVYGTSIVQGGCASRPGMAYPAIIGRWLDRPMINLGFSGNGPMRPELTPLIGELDPLLFVIDSLPNMDADAVRRATEPFVTGLRAARPDTPIVLVENLVYQNTLAETSPTKHGPKNEELRAAFDRLQQAGVPGLHLIGCDDLLGDDFEASVDGGHPTDLGFHRMATAICPALKGLITST